MGRDPDDMQREVEHIRAELAQTIDEIAERLSPRRAAERGKEEARQRLVRLREAAIAHREAVAAGAVAVVGVVVVLVALRRRGKSSAVKPVVVPTARRRRSRC